VELSVYATDGDCMAVHSPSEDILVGSCRKQKPVEDVDRGVI